MAADAAAPSAAFATGGDSVYLDPRKTGASMDLTGFGERSETTDDLADLDDGFDAYDLDDDGYRDDGWTPEPGEPYPPESVETETETSPDPVTAFDAGGPPADSPPPDDAATDWAPAVSGWSDPATSTDGPRYWDRMLSSERARARRSRRPATVVLVEIAGLDELAATAGGDAARMALTNAGRTLTQQVRASDCVARTDRARFSIFLPETDEIEAINFVERARTAMETSLADAVGTDIAMGWASPADGDLDVALDVAERRLLEELAALGSER